MSTKKIVWISMFIGSALGAYLPVLWGESLISIASVLTTAIGGFVGIFVGLKIGNSING